LTGDSPEASTAVHDRDPHRAHVTAATTHLAAILGISSETVTTQAHALRLDSLGTLELGARLEAEGWTGGFEMLRDTETIADILDRVSQTPPADGQIETGIGQLTIPPSMQGRGVSLTPVVPQDIDFLYRFSISEETGFRWRFRGSTPSFDAFNSVLWSGITAQFVVREGRGKPIGHAIIYNADFNLGIAYIGVAIGPPFAGGGQGIEAARLLLHHAFCTWALRICYMELPEFNYHQFASGEGRLFHIEGRLRNAEVYGGRYYDRMILAISREHFYENEDVQRAPGL
jgi:RimJ/RimL family protein N-acetyltransferase